MFSLKRKTLAIALALCGLQAAVTAQKSATTIQRVTVLGAGAHIEVEITASGPVTPQAQVITGPDRLIIDFPNAIPGSSLRNLAVNRGDVKNVRVGLFASAPPVTRVVVDLSAAPHYQVFPSGKTVIVKLSPDGATPPLTSASAVVPMTTTPAVPAVVVPAPKPVPKFRVDFHNGNLTIWSDKATLAEILNEVHRRTGAEVPIPAGAEQERVAADMKPMPAREALATLLNGSRFNFVMVGSAQDSAQLRGVFLTPKTGGVGISVTPTTYSVASKQPQMAENDPDQDPGPPPGADNNANNMPDAPAPEDAPQQPQQ